MLVPPVFSPAVVMLLLPMVFSVLLLLVFLLPILLPMVVLVPFLGGSQVAVAQSLTHNPLRFLRRGLYAKHWVSGR